MKADPKALERAALAKLRKKAPDLPDDERDRIVDETVAAIAKQAAGGKIRTSATAAARVHAWGLARRYLAREKRRGARLANEAAAALERQRMTDPMAAVEARLDAEKLGAREQKIRRRPRVGDKRYGNIDELKAAVTAYAWEQVRARVGDLHYADIHLGMFGSRDRARQQALPAARAEHRRRRRRGDRPPVGEVNDPADRRGGLVGFLDEWRQSEGLTPRDLTYLSLLADLWPARLTAPRLRKTPLSVLEAVREQETNVRATLAAEARRLAKLEADPGLRRMLELLVEAMRERT